MLKKSTPLWDTRHLSTLPLATGRRREHTLDTSVQTLEWQDDLADQMTRYRTHIRAVLGMIKACMWISLTVVAVDLNQMSSLAKARFGDRASETVADWHGLLASAEPESTLKQLELVNDFFNSRVRWSTDRDIYDTEDYWATPLETMGRLVGDCEDFSIAKFASLRELGIPPEQLRLIYVKAISGGLSQAHMVLAWYETPRSMPLILDNINQTILPANQRRDLQPVFSFNSEELWLGATGNRVSASPQARMSRWRQVLDQMRKEGLEG